jgi:ketosteroid isomerase-like protein
MKRTTLIAAMVALIILVNAAASNAQQGAASRPGKQEMKAIAEIRAVLDAQTAAWNRGDIEGYMQGYARSPDTLFVSGDTLTRGWQTVLDRYKKGYDTREKMGTLSFSDLEVKLISKDAAVAMGRWQLTREKDMPHGRFTLIFRRSKEGWRIVHDHTSSAS